MSCKYPQHGIPSSTCPECGRIHGRNDQQKLYAYHFANGAVLVTSLLILAFALVSIDPFDKLFGFACCLPFTCASAAVLTTYRKWPRGYRVATIVTVALFCVFCASGFFLFAADVR